MNAKVALACSRIRELLLYNFKSKRRVIEVKTYDIERMLTEPDDFKKLYERAQAIKRKYGDSGDAPVLRVDSLDPSINEFKPTEEELKSNNFDNTSSRKYLLADIGRYIPQLTQTEPKKALSALIDEFHKKPTKSNHSPVEDAINRLTTAGELNDESRKLCAKAIESFTVYASFTTNEVLKEFEVEDAKGVHKVKVENV